MPSWPGIFQFNTCLVLLWVIPRCTDFFKCLYFFFKVIYPIGNVISISRFYYKISLHLLHPVIGISALHYLTFAGRIFSLILESPVLIVLLDPVSVFFFYVTLLLLISNTDLSFPVVLSNLCAVLFWLWVFSNKLLIDGISLKTKWRQVSSDLQDFSRYSSWS